jgi:predicted thioesterase
MKQIFADGAVKIYTKLVTHSDTATFDSGTVHQVYATFAIARDSEWAGRLFVLDMLEEGEEGIGTFVHIQHLQPALVGETVVITAILKGVEKNNIVCEIEARVNNRLIATGETGQKILPKSRIEELFASLR